MTTWSAVLFKRRTDFCQKSFYLKNRCIFHKMQQSTWQISLYSVTLNVCNIDTLDIDALDILDNIHTERRSQMSWIRSILEKYRCVLRITIFHLNLHAHFRMLVRSGWIFFQFSYFCCGYICQYTFYLQEGYT